MGLTSAACEGRRGHAVWFSMLRRRNICAESDRVAVFGTVHRFWDQQRFSDHTGIDLSVGGQNSSPVAGTLPARMKVDYVHVWQQKVQ